MRDVLALDRLLRLLGSDDAHALAVGLARITTVAFFVIFLVFLATPAIRRRGGAEEALSIALALGACSALPAW